MACFPVPGFEWDQVETSNGLSHVCMYVWMDGWMDVCMYVCMYFFFLERGSWLFGGGLPMYGDGFSGHLRCASACCSAMG